MTEAIQPAADLVDSKETAAAPESNTLKLEKSPTEPQTPTLFDVDKMSDDEKKQKAREWGHIPQDQFRGDKSRWVDEGEFLKRSQERMPALQHQIRKQDDIINSQRMIIESLQKDVEREREELHTQKKEASEDQDFFKYTSLEKKEKALEERNEMLKNNLDTLSNHQQQEQVDNREVEMQHTANQWVNRNPWFQNPQSTEDFAKRSFAEMRFDEYKRTYPNAAPNAIMQQIDIDLQNFNQTPSNSYNYSSGGVATAPSTSNERNYSNLTESAKKICDNFSRMGRSAEEREFYRKEYIKAASEDLFKWSN